MAGKGRKKNPQATQVLKQVAALNNMDTAPNRNADPMTPMSRTVRSVPFPRTPATVLDPGQPAMATASVGDMPSG